MTSLFVHMSRDLVLLMSHLGTGAIWTSAIATATDTLPQRLICIKLGSRGGRVEAENKISDFEKCDSGKACSKQF